MSQLAKFLRRDSAPEQRMMTSSALAPPWDGGIGTDIVGELRAMQSMALFACVRLLADVIASMPWYLYKRDKNNVPQRIYPSPAVVRKPCVDMDLFQWKWMVVNSLALRGNSYHLITGRDAQGNPSGLLPIHPDMVFLERRVNVLEWYDPIYRVLGERVPREDIIHIRRFTIPGEPYGLSPIRQAARTIGITLAAEEYGYRYFKDSANPSGLLTTEQSLDDVEIERNMREWISTNGGRRLPAMLSGGMDYKTIAIPPDEAQFLETRQAQTSDIARFYGVPPHLIGDQEKSTAWGSGIAEMNLAFHTYTLLGWTTCIESAISNFLPRGQVVRFDPSAMLRGDFKTQIAALKEAREAGMFSVNDGRANLEMSPVENGDGYIQPLNFGPIGATPVVVPMPKAIQEETPPGSTPVSGTQQPEPAGIGGTRSATPLCRLGVDGRPQYYEPYTGEDIQEVPDDQEN